MGILNTIQVKKCLSSGQIWPMGCQAVTSGLSLVANTSSSSNHILSASIGPVTGSLCGQGPLFCPGASKDGGNKSHIWGFNYPNGPFSTKFHHNSCIWWAFDLPQGTASWLKVFSAFKSSSSWLNVLCQLIWQACSALFSSLLRVKPTWEAMCLPALCSPMSSCLPSLPSRAWHNPLHKAPLCALPSWKPQNKPKCSFLSSTI